MKFTTTALVKARLSKTDTDDDTTLDAMIDGISARAERYMGRSVELKARTVYLNVAPGQREYLLDAQPVASIASVYFDIDRVYLASSLLSASDYVVDDESGLLHLEFDPEVDREYRNALKIVYTGGLAADAAGLSTAGYPDLVEAMTQQACFEFQRTRNLHIASQSEGSSSVQLTELGWLPHVKEVLDNLTLQGFR